MDIYELAWWLVGIMEVELRGQINITAKHLVRETVRMCE